jgi:hypothetical protein
MRRQYGNRQENMMQILPRLFAGETVGVVGLNEKTVQPYLDLFTQHLGDKFTCETIMSASKGLAPKFIYDEEGIVGMLPKPKERLIGYTFKMK